MVPVLSAVCFCSRFFFFFQTTGKLNCSLAYIVKPRLVFALLAVLNVDVRFAPRVTCTGSSSCRFCCCLVTVGGGVSPDVWPQLSDTPGGLTDSGGAMSGASPPTSQKDALPSSKPNKPSPPSSPSNRGQKEVSKVNGSVQEELSPPPMEVAPKEQSKSGPLEKKKDPVGENCQVHPFMHHLIIALTSHCPDHSLPPCSCCLGVASEFHVSISHSTRFHLIRYQSHLVAFMCHFLGLAVTKCL